MAESVDSELFNTRFQALCAQLGLINENNYNDLDAIITIIRSPMDIVYVAKYAKNEQWGQMTKFLFPNITVSHVMNLASGNGVNWQSVDALDLMIDFDILNGELQKQKRLYALKFLYELARRRGDNRNEPTVVPVSPPKNEV